MPAGGPGRSHGEARAWGCERRGGDVVVLVVLVRDMKWKRMAYLCGSTYCAGAAGERESKR